LTQKNAEMSGPRYRIDHGGRQSTSTVVGRITLRKHHAVARKTADVSSAVSPQSTGGPPQQRTHRTLRGSTFAFLLHENRFRDVTSGARPAPTGRLRHRGGAICRSARPLIGDAVFREGEVCRIRRSRASVSVSVFGMLWQCLFTWVYCGCPGNVFPGVRCMPRQTLSRTE
jgi:hypothetical protein